MDVGAARLLGQRLQDALDAGDLPALDGAIDMLREVLAGLPENDPDRPMHLANLAAASSVRFDWTGRRSDIDAATDAARQAVAAVDAGHPARAVYLANLGGVLSNRHQVTGDPADRPSARLADQLYAELS